ncbi:MAG: hypothetical protein COB94_008185 [Gammaproteobacteria bacterium]|nr:hypothetical protein [Gammaproteobacteria bacterium]
MNFSGPVLVSIATYVLMLLAYRYRSKLWFHIPVMSAIIVYDICMPFYLYSTRDWYRRLIEQEEIFSMMIWTHIMLLITLYVLYALQIIAGRQLLKGGNEGREDHAAQGKGILIARALVILSAMMLVEPERPVEAVALLLGG